MRSVCAFCGSDLYASCDTTFECAQERISHGICPECAFAYLAGSGQSMRAFLDELQGPVILVDRFKLPLEANSAARQLLPDKTLTELGNYTAGELFGCVEADKPGGCGKQLHCQSCTLRRSVTHTLETRQSLHKVPALAELSWLNENQRVSFEISTEYVDEHVLVRIDHMKPENHAASTPFPTEGVDRVPKEPNTSPGDSPQDKGFM